RPARALLARIPLGPRPSLHRLRCARPCRRLRSGLFRFVRRLLSYYGEVRLLVPVHHRLRLLAFPMRTAVLGTHSTTAARQEISQVPIRSLWPTSGLRPRQGVSSSHVDAANVAFE